MTPPTHSLLLGSSTDSSLLRQVRNHAPDAWNRLVEWAGPLVLYWCRKAELPPEDREEVFQDVFLAVAENIGRFRLDEPGSSFRGWILIITRNKIVDLVRRRINQPAAQGGSEAYQKFLALADEQLSASELANPEAKALQLRRALDLIRPEFAHHVWQAFWRTAVDGLSAPEVATELRMTSQAVRKAKSRILARLRDEFGGLLE